MHHKKLYLILIGLIAIISFLLFKAVKETSEITISKQKIPLISSGTIFIPIEKEDPIYGNPGSAITIIEFNDFTCKDCKRVHNELVDYVDKNPQKARLVWKSLPKQTFFTVYDPLPHQAAICAHQQDQDKFWQFVKIAMQDENDVDQTGLAKIAQGLNLNMAKWKNCFSDNKTVKIVSSSTAIAKQYGFANALPTVFINNRWINVQTEINLTDILTQFAKE